MKKTFVCSLICPGGIVGGGICIADTAITYRTNKLTVDRKYRNLVLPFHEIRELAWKRVVFPIAAFHMANGDTYKVMIFNKRRFEKYFNLVAK